MPLSCASSSHQSHPSQQIAGVDAISLEIRWCNERVEAWLREFSTEASTATLAQMGVRRRTELTPRVSDSTRSPETLASYRDRLSRGEDAIDPDRWAGALPAAYGVPPRIRIGRDKWSNLLWLITIGFVLLICAVAADRSHPLITPATRAAHTNPSAERIWRARSGSHRPRSLIDPRIRR